MAERILLKVSIVMPKKKVKMKGDSFTYCSRWFERLKLESTRQIRLLYSALRT
jgi:hypothetical protein